MCKIIYRILIEKDVEIDKLRKSLLEISEEVTKMHGALAIIDKSPVDVVTKSGVTDTHGTKAVLTQLQHVHTSIRHYKRLVVFDYKESLCSSMLLCLIIESQFVDLYSPEMFANTVNLILLNNHYR